jgi:hypothetical protein
MSLTDVAPQPTPASDHADLPASAPEPGPTIDLTREATPRPQFTITEAATACAVSRKTITRKLADLAEHGAAKDPDGVWRIPVEALLAVGLHPGRSLPEHRDAQAARPRDLGAAVPSTPGPGAASSPQRAPDVVTIPRERWDDLRIRRARAEAEAAERALALADARLALRALTAGPAAAPAATAPIEAPSGGAPAAPVALGPGPAAGADTIGEIDPLAAARSRAAQTGGSVTAEGLPRRRRWWQSRQG